MSILQLDNQEEQSIRGEIINRIEKARKDFEFIWFKQVGKDLTLAPYNETKVTKQHLELYKPLLDDLRDLSGVIESNTLFSWAVRHFQDFKEPLGYFEKFTDLGLFLYFTRFFGRFDMRLKRVQQDLTRVTASINTALNELEYRSQFGKVTFSDLEIGHKEFRLMRGYMSHVSLNGLIPVLNTEGIESLEVGELRARLSNYQQECETAKIYFNQLLEDNKSYIEGYSQEDVTSLVESRMQYEYKEFLEHPDLIDVVNLPFSRIQKLLVSKYYFEAKEGKLRRLTNLSKHELFMRFDKLKRAINHLETLDPYAVTQIQGILNQEGIADEWENITLPRGILSLFGELHAVVGVALAKYYLGASVFVGLQLFTGELYTRAKPDRVNRLHNKDVQVYFIGDGVIERYLLTKTFGGIHLEETEGDLTNIIRSRNEDNARLDKMYTSVKKELQQLITGSTRGTIDLYLVEQVVDRMERSIRGYRINK